MQSLSQRIDEYSAGNSKEVRIAALAVGVFVISGIAAISSGLGDGHPLVTKVAGYTFFVSGAIAIIALTLKPIIDYIRARG